MSKTLTLFGSGWASIQAEALLGSRRDIIGRLRCLLAHPELPSAIACQAHRMAGQMLLETEQYPKARRHFRAAAALQPTDGETFYQWGLTHERDPLGCDHLAVKQFRKAMEIEAANPLYRAAFGRAAVRCDRLKRGIRELLAAAALAPGNMAVIRIVTEGLLEAGRFQAAEGVLNKARFLCFETVKDREVVELMERVRFESVRCEQRRTTRHGHGAEFAKDGGRVVLPFVRVTSGSKEVRTGTKANKSARRDVVSLPRPHFPRLRVRRADG
jgi:tetratricopeptide (TPR) repeat protein